MHRRTFIARTAQAGAALSLFGCASGPGLSAPPGSFADLRDRYFLRVLELNPVTSTYLGGDGWNSALATANGRLRDYRPAALSEELGFYRGIQSELGRIDAASLSEHDRIDYDVLKAQLAFILHQTGDLKYYQRAIDTYVAEPFRGVDWQIQQMTDAGNGQLGSDGEWQLVAARLRAVPSYVAVAQENLLAGKRENNLADWRMVQRDGISGSRANADYFRQTFPALARQYIGARSFGGSLLPSLDEAARAAAAAYESFAAFLDSNFGSLRQDRFAIGEREYEWRLHNNLRDARSAAQLWDYGAQQVAYYQDLIYTVAAEVAGTNKLGLRFDTPDARNAAVRGVMDFLSKDSPRNDDELLSWYVGTGKRAVQYGRDQKLFDIPTDYRLDVVATPPVLRSTIDAAYYPAPPFKKTGVGRFYLTPTGNDAAALAQNNRASVADTAIHEGFPGHDWHYKYMTQHAGEISNIRWLTPGAVEDSSSMWEDSMAAEGWGLYSEELMSEAAPGRPYGFYTPGEYLYELQGQLLRAVRVRVDVGIHTGRMTFDEAVDYFTTNEDFMPGACARAASDPAARAACDTAQRALYRYSKWPTQAITYNLGKNAIVALREDYRRKEGAAYNARTFHERFMGMGTIPVGYFRDAFLR
ncbi:MAG TPA: DUF885 domain-containing protein [Longimicrobiales bacterium]